MPSIAYRKREEDNTVELGEAQWVEHLLSIHKALGWVPSINQVSLRPAPPYMIHKTLSQVSK